MDWAWAMGGQPWVPILAGHAKKNPGVRSRVGIESLEAAKSETVAGAALFQLIFAEVAVATRNQVLLAEHEKDITAISLAFIGIFEDDRQVLIVGQTLQGSAVVT